MYVMAITGAFMLVKYVHMDSMFWNALLLDVLTTWFIFLFSYLYRNSSIYDPYWSVMPVLLAIYWFQFQGPGGTEPGNLLILSAIVFWGVRLTANWAFGWGGLKHEDWRYLRLKAKTGKYYWPTSLTGIHMLPTLVVFLACLPVYTVAISDPVPLNVLDWIGFFIAIGGTVLEMISDLQLRRYRNMKPVKDGEVLDKGLWAWSRHPNYLGEITFWAGLFVMALGASWANWWTVIGLAGMVLLFAKVSIPMMEERQLESKPGYAEYMRKTPALFPGIPK